jgi:hypothetical protein
MKVSTARKLGVVARIAARQAGNNRTLSAIWRGMKVTASSFTRVLGVLWLEVTGFVFLSLSVIGGLALIREYGRYEAGKTSAGRVVIAVCFTVTFAWFGITSFWRARRKL